MHNRHHDDDDDTEEIKKIEVPFVPHRKYELMTDGRDGFKKDPTRWRPCSPPCKQTTDHT